LRQRREELFANEIKGDVKNGQISNWLLYQYSFPSMSTIPLGALITIWVIQFYELLGADLSQLARCSRV
jgi:hypothetical protein